MDWPQGAHGNTYGGNPLACVAALATIDLIEDGMLQNAVEQGSFALDALAEMQCRHPSIGHVRGKGLMVGVEFVQDRQTKKAAHKLRDRILDRAFSHGLLLLGCGESTIRLSPPLNVPHRLLDEGLQILDAAIGEAEAQGLD
jgi:4-aminobutyrate aminotransferase